MNNLTQKLIFSVALSASAVCANPALAQDACARKWDEATTESKAAKDAFERKYWQQAAYAHQRLASKWDDAAYACSGKNRDTARQLSEDARRNGASAQANWDADKCRSYTQPAANTYESANSAMLSQDWPRARDLYQRASNQYENASRTCDGEAASNAAANASVAADNARRASENIDIKTGNDLTMTCQPDVEAALETAKQARKAASDDQFKTAAQLYGRTEVMFLKLAKNCQSRFKDDFTEKAEMAKMLKEDYTKRGQKKK